MKAWAIQHAHAERYEKDQLIRIDGKLTAVFDFRTLAWQEKDTCFHVPAVSV